MNILAKIKFGSHLYGTASENSDLDYKGIYMPSLEDILLGRVKKSINLSTNKSNQKNSKDDVDIEFYSLHYFIHLACEGETVALDMLHAPDNMIVETSDIWKILQRNKHQFYTKNLKAFIGYARRQASKYGIKGSRLNDAKKVLEYFEYCMDFETIKKHWDYLPEGEHIFKLSPTDKSNNERLYEVCGRKINENAKISYSREIVKKFYEAYGERARQAANNENIDWKAVSHALRAAFQVKEILLEKTITFPLASAYYLKQVKAGKLDYQTEVAPQLDSLMDEVEELSKSSDLPMKVNRNYWDAFTIEQIYKFYGLESWVYDLH